MMLHRSRVRYLISGWARRVRVVNTQFADVTLGQRLQRLGIDDLGQVVVFVDVHAGLGEALERDAGAAHLGEAVDVECVDAETGLDLHAHLVGPRFGAVIADPHRQVFGTQAAVAGRLGQVERVRRRARDRRDAEVAHELELAVGVAAGDRQHGGAEPFAAVVQAEAAGEQAVAVGVLQHVARLHAAGRQGARDQIGPQVDVGGDVADRRRITGRARRGVHAHEFVARHGEHAERIMVAQVDLGRQRQVGDVAVTADSLGRDAGLVELLPVERDIVVGIAQCRAQAPDLQLAEFGSGERLALFLPEEAALLIGRDLAGRVEAGAHRLVTSSSDNRVTLSLSSSTARSMSCTAKQMFWNEML